MHRRQANPFCSNRIASGRRPVRSGSVMIMVVSLLVLLALIGTAWIATTRTDRVSSQQNVANTQIDLLVEGTKNMAVQAVIDDLFGRTGGGSPVFRPYSSTDPVSQYTYNHFTSAIPDSGGAVTSFLSSRLPQIDRQPSGAAIGNPYWPVIARPLVSGIPFESPLTATQYGAAAADRQRVEPASINVTVSGVSTPSPAFRIGGNLYLAADTDGDGIADAGLWRLPTSPINGVTYYAAVRIIDNNSAINAAVASRPIDPKNLNDYDLNKSWQIPANLFPSNIDLSAILDTSTGDDTRLRDYRLPGVPPFAVPVDEGNASRADFEYLSEFELLWSQLGRRVDNPGYVFSGTLAQALSASDQISLASRFILNNPSTYTSAPLRAATAVETLLSRSLLTVTDSEAAYQPGDVLNWFDKNFDDRLLLPSNVSPNFNRRPLLVTRNGVTNQIPQVIGGTAPFNSYALDACKASANTAPFASLYRAYGQVMGDRFDQADTTPFWRDLFGKNLDSDVPLGGYANPYRGTSFKSDQSPVTNEQHPARIFRSALRDPRAANAKVRIGPAKQLLIRAALAALNTIQMRQSASDRYFPQTISLSGWTDDEATNTCKQTTLSVTCYGYRPQPFITEIYASNDTVSEPNGSKNDKGYIAVELYNPYPYDISLKGWKLATLNRQLSGTNPYPKMQFEQIADFNAPADVETLNPTIPAGGFLLLENLGSAAASATYRPESTGLPFTGKKVGVNTLRVNRLDKAFDRELVLLRPVVDGITGQSPRAMVPVDQFDFTGLTVESGKPEVKNWHYARNTVDGDPWKFVYPGRYSVTAVGTPRHQGTDVASFDTTSEVDPWKTTPPIGRSLGARGPASYPQESVFVIPLSWDDVAGPNASAPATTDHFPFGGFARDGDLLQVPMIGAYRIVDVNPLLPNAVLEANAISMDSVFAEDTDTKDDPFESVGRIAPLAVSPNPQDAGFWPYTPNNDANDWSETPSKWRYHFGFKLFDYLTVQSPQDDYTPNSPDKFTTSGSRDPVANSDPNLINGAAENAVGVQGLININTAPVRVLASVPFIPIPRPTATQADRDKRNKDNYALARAIVAYRDTNGPFKNLFDLFRVPEFRDLAVTIATGPEPTAFDGDISPLAGPDGIRGDSKEKFLALTRVSNLITTRSDTFTAYLLVQGWRNAGSGNPELVAQRRVGFIIDRSRVTAVNRNVRVIPVPQD